MRFESGDGRDRNRLRGEAFDAADHPDFTMFDQGHRLAVAAGPAGTVTVLDPDDKPVEFDSKGYDHFA